MLTLQEESYVGTLEGCNADGCWQRDLERSYEALGRVGHEVVAAQAEAAPSPGAPTGSGAEAQEEDKEVET